MGGHRQSTLGHHGAVSETRLHASSGRPPDASGHAPWGEAGSVTRITPRSVRPREGDLAELVADMCVHVRRVRTRDGCAL